MLRSRNFVPALLIVLAVAANSLNAQEPAAAKAEADAAKQKLYDRFTEKMNGVKLVGKFTVLGKEQADLPTEEYEIRSVKKLAEGEKWELQARIKYGKLDAVVPLELDVEWAGDTPVISLTNLLIPGLGTFSSRVLFYNDKYAGTWTHGKVGGHMFGTVEKLEPAPAESK